MNFHSAGNPLSEHCLWIATIVSMHLKVEEIKRNSSFIYKKILVQVSGFQRLCSHLLFRASASVLEAPSMAEVSNDLGGRLKDKWKTVFFPKLYLVITFGYLGLMHLCSHLLLKHRLQCVGGPPLWPEVSNDLGGGLNQDKWKTVFVPKNYIWLSWTVLTCFLEHQLPVCPLCGQRFPMTWGED